jgi:probable DNA metabolism protein
MEVNKYISYLYDGSFYGILTVIYESYYSHSIPINISLNTELQNPQQSFLNDYKLISTDNEKAEKVNQAILNKISPEALEQIYHAYLSNVKGKELIIYNYIKLGFKIGKAIDSHLYSEEVSALHKIAKKVIKEVMNMVGFIRFTYNNNFYYAIYEPDHNISELIAPHFAERFADQYFIIHDIRRNIAVIYDTKEWILTSFYESELEKLNIPDEELGSSNDICYEKLWKEYFINIAIKERENLSQQKMHMPKRYWKNMLETKE